MARAVVEVRGAKRLRATMKRAGLDLKELTPLNRAAAETVSSAARLTAPIGPDKGGHIAATIRPGATTRAGIVRVGNKSKPYAGVIHWGWPARNIRPNTWLVDAAKATEPRWVATYWAGLNRIIDRIEGL